MRGEISSPIRSHLFRMIGCHLLFPFSGHDMLSAKKLIYVTLIVASISWFAMPESFAQTTTAGGTGTGGFGDTGQDASAQNTGGQNTGANAAGGLRTADEAFSNVQRGDTIGSTAGTGASFSGASAANGAGGGLGGLGGGFGGGFGGFGGLGGIFGNQGVGGGQSSQPAIRTRLRSAVEVTPPLQTQIQQSANRRFYQVPARAGLQNVSVVVEGQTAIVTGTVSSERERRMSELLMRLEPGVRNVDNRTRVVSPAPGFGSR